MTAYYDHRAERTVAEAEAATRRAQAEALRAETSLRVQRERRQLQREDALDERRDKADRQAAKAERRKNRRAGLRRGARALVATAKTRSHSIVGAAAMGSPMFIAWGGQYAFADEVMHLGTAAVTLPIAMEGSVLYTAYLTHQAIDKGLPTGRYRLMTWAMASNAAGMNLWHQVDKVATDADPWKGLQVGAIYAVSSLLGIVLWEMNAALKRQVVSRRAGADIRRAAWRRLRYPRLSWSAASIRAAQGCTVEDAWTVAWNDRYGIGPDASRRDRRLARKIVRYRGKADQEAAKSGRLAIRDGVIVGRPPVDPSPPSPEGDKAIEQLRNWDGEAATRRALRRADLATMLPPAGFDVEHAFLSRVGTSRLAPLKPLASTDARAANTDTEPRPTLSAPHTDLHTPEHTPDEQQSEYDREDGDDRRTPTEQDNRAAEEWIRARCRGRNGLGRRPTHAEVADRYGFSPGWGGRRVRAVQDRMSAQGYEFQDDSTVIAPRKSLTESVTTVNGSSVLHEASGGEA